MELVNRNGNTYFVPVSDHECASGITSFYKWEQAFRIFSNVYTRFFPHRATELIQYNHIICTASQNFIWDNVYLYDREFCMHLSNFPECSWSVILQQAWAICLRDKLKKDEGRGRGSEDGHKFKKDNCKRFNKEPVPLEQVVSSTIGATIVENGAMGRIFVVVRRLI